MVERDLFIEALKRPDPAESAAYLDRACAGDVALRRKVEMLLMADAEASAILRETAPPSSDIAEPDLGWRTTAAAYSPGPDSATGPEVDHGSDFEWVQITDDPRFCDTEATVEFAEELGSDWGAGTNPPLSESEDESDENCSIGMVRRPVPPRQLAQRPRIRVARRAGPRRDGCRLQGPAPSLEPHCRTEDDQ